MTGGASGGAVNCTASLAPLLPVGAGVTRAMWRINDEVLVARSASAIVRLVNKEVAPLRAVSTYLFLDDLAAAVAALPDRGQLQVLCDDPLLVATLTPARQLSSAARALLAQADGVLDFPAHARRPRGITGIEWADVTWNPVAGCSIISAGCRNCYAMATASGNEAKARGIERLGRHPGGLQKYVGLTEKAANGVAVWTGEVGVGLDHEWDKPFGWRTARHIFINSMSDLFYEGFDDAVRDRVFGVISDPRAAHHRFQLLTKRPDAAAAYFSRRPQFTKVANLWLGVTVESADVVDRIDTLRRIPVPRRWLSVEPLISALPSSLDLSGIGWVVTGGESGAKARLRRCSPDWVRHVRDACFHQGTRFFHKQWGAYANNPLVTEHQLDAAEAAQIDAFGAGGALLDGVLHHDRPDW